MLLETLLDFLERLALGFRQQEPTPDSGEYREGSIYKSDLGSQSSTPGLIVCEIRVCESDEPGEKPIGSCGDRHDFPPVRTRCNFAATYPHARAPRNVEREEEQEYHRNNARGYASGLVGDGTQTTHDHEKKSIEQRSINQEWASTGFFDESLRNPDGGESNRIEDDTDRECVGNADLEEKNNAIARDEIDPARLLEGLEGK